MASPPSYSAETTATQLDFSQAMTDFKIMFPDMDADVIEAVLRSNNGAVDLTIDHLLTMSVDVVAQPPPEQQQASTQLNVSDVAAILKSGGSRQHGMMSPPTYFQATQGDLINLEEDEPQILAAPTEPKTTVDLLSDLDLNAADFPPKQQQQILAYCHPERQKSETHQLQEEEAKKNQLLEDERIAVMLQNEEFMAELQRDREFMSALEMDAAPPSSTSKMSKVPPKAMMDEAVFREKLKDMGKTSKRKFAQLASVFSRRKGARQLLGGHHPPTSDDNLNAEPLINEDSDGEDQVVASKTPTKGKYTSFS